MDKVENSLYSLFFKATHAIMVMKKGSAITKPIAKEITDHLDRHYNGKKFILITHRIHAHEIDLDVYKGRILKNMIGFAIVSKNPEEIKRAGKEQSLWDQSFTFFEELNEAEEWAKSFFT